MSSQQGPYHYSGTSPTYDESGSESPVTRQVPSPGQLWSPTTMTGDPSGYSEHDQIVNLSEVSEVDNGSLHSFHGFNNPISHPSFSDPRGMDYPFNYPGPSQPLPSVSSQDPGVGVDATYINANPFFNSPLYYTEFGHGHPQYPGDYIPYPDYDFQLQPPAHYPYQPPVQDLYTQIPHAPLTVIDPSMSWTQHSSPSLGEPVYQADCSTPCGSVLDGANSARTLDPIAGQHSHHSPVATFSNQMSAPSTSHPSPSSPDRERKRPSTADDSPRPRRVAPRHDETSSVHFPDSIRRRRSNPEVYGRGISIPQERYRTSTISSYNAPHHPPVITFNLDNPDQVGIPIIDILHKAGGFARIRDRTEAFNMEKKTFTLRVRWPGYKSWSKTIAALDWTKSRAPVTRVKLAEAVATAIRDLFEKYRDEQYDPEYARWNVGQSGIQLDQVCLVALHRVSRGSWQPQLCLLGPRH